MKLSFDYDSSEQCEIAQIGQIYRVRVVQDPDCESPRDWDNVATMVCEHRHYNLGDNDGSDIAIDAIRSSRDYRPTWEESESGQFKFKGETRDCFDLSEPCDIWQAIQLCSDIVSQPLYLYDHSGLSISTGAFSCPWDSGQIGFAFVTFDTIRKETGCKAVKAKQFQWAQSRIDAETKTYDDYLRGNVYGWITEIATEWDSGIASEWEELDSCSGYYGYDHDKSGLAESAIASIQADIASRKETPAATIPDSLCELIAARKTLTGDARTILQRQIAGMVADIRAANVQRYMVESLA